jgi:hypothetical protein
MYPDILSEAEAMLIPPLTDMRSASSARHSRLWVSGRRFRVGDPIVVNIHMCDGYNTPRTVGGDDIRVSMSEVNTRASTSGYVRDHHNGTYTATFTAFWSGNVNITAALLYPREAIAALYRIRRINATSLRPAHGMFMRNGHSEITHCEPFEIVDRAEKTNVCDLSKMNYGDPWFCVRPRNSDLSCSDWTQSNIGYMDPKPYVTQAEDEILIR